MGRLPTGTSATTVRVEVSITETVPSPKFATYARVPAGFTATPYGWRPTATVPTTVLDAPSTTETLFAPMLAIYAKGAPIAAGTAISESASRPTRIPERRFIPENLLGSGPLVFMPCDSAASMPAVRTNIASGCLREVSRGRESERRDGSAATADFRQFRKFDRKFTTGLFRLFRTYTRPAEIRSPTNLNSRSHTHTHSPSHLRGNSRAPKTRRTVRPENIASADELVATRNFARIEA